MKQTIYTRVIETLKRYFSVNEIRHFKPKKLLIENKETYKTQKRVFDYAFIREYYYHGIRFFIGVRELPTDNDAEIFFYARAGYMGGYRPLSEFPFEVPAINGYVVFHADLLSEIEEGKNYELMLDDVFKYLKMQERKHGHERKPFLKNFEREIFDKELESLFAPADQLFGKAYPHEENNPATPAYPPNPYSMKVYDGEWIIRRYKEITLLVGLKISYDVGQGMNVQNFYLFARLNEEKFNLKNNSEHLLKGYNTEPKDFRTWTLVYGGEYLEKNKLFSDALLNLGKLWEQLKKNKMNKMSVENFSISNEEFDAFLNSTDSDFLSSVDVSLLQSKRKLS